MKGIIMAGGEGSRLRPLTCGLPKPMVPILNKPIMVYCIKLLKKHGIIDIGVTLQYKPEAIRDYFDNGSDLGVKLNYFLEETPLGTAGSIKNAESFLDQTFIVVSGDALTNIDLESAINFHKENKATATLVLKRVKVPLDYGVVVTDKAGRIERFLEKPNWGELFSDTVNTGIYILEPEVLSYFDAGLKFDFSKDLFPLLMKKNKPLYGFITDDYWCDIGNTKTYLESHFDLLSNPSLVPFSASIHKDNVYYGRGATIDKEALIEGPAYIGDFSKIEKGAYIGPYSVIGKNCRISEGVSIKRSVLWDRVAVGALSEIRGAILCNNVDIRARTSIYEGVVVGSNSQIKDGAILNPLVKIWPFKTIDEKSIVNENLIWGTKSSRHLFGNDGIYGTVNRDIDPLRACRLGAAFGAYLKAGKRVAVSTDGGRASIMLKHSIISGLLSTGQEVYDAGHLSSPLLRFSIRELGIDGGIHIFTVSDKPDGCRIHMLNEKGGNLLVAEERKIENLFIRDDFPRQASQDIKRVHELSDLILFYIRSVLKSLDLKTMQKKELKILLSCPNRICSYVINKVLGQAGCKIIPTSANLEKTMSKVSFDLACRIDETCEDFDLYDEKGNRLEKTQVQALLSLIYLKGQSRQNIVIPYNASDLLEDLAKKYDCSVKRSKTVRSTFMEETIKLDQNHLGESLFALYFDAGYGIIKLVELLSKENTSLSRLSQDLPKLNLRERQVYCPWSSKGRVMRKIIEEERDKKRQVELLEGIKINHKDGWALILPDSEDPIFRVYSDGLRGEYAEELGVFYENKIRKLSNDNDKH